MKQYKTVIGLDPSLTGTGVCVMKFDEKDVTVLSLATIKSKPTLHPYARIGRYKQIVRAIFDTPALKSIDSREILITIEGYSFGARGSAATALPELGALIRNEAEQAQVPWVEFTPPSIKKFGTGTGAAKKDLVLMHVQQKYGHMLIGTGFQLEDSNQGDAFVIALMGVEYIRAMLYGQKLSKEHALVFKAMDKQRFWQLRDAHSLI